MKNPRLTIEQRRKLRREMTKSERTLWGRVRGKRLKGIKFRRQYGIGPYILDFFIPSLNIAIEIDGSIHSLEEVKLKDQNKDAFLKNNGIQVVRIKNEEINNDIHKVLNNLVEVIEKNRI